jgi:hypothetical protein
MYARLRTKKDVIDAKYFDPTPVPSKFEVQMGNFRSRSPLSKNIVICSDGARNTCSEQVTNITGAGAHRGQGHRPSPRVAEGPETARRRLVLQHLGRSLAKERHMTAPAAKLKGGAIERVRYFPRQLMTAEDMRAEQEYFVERMRQAAPVVRKYPIT